MLAVAAKPKHSCEETQYQRGTVPFRKFHPVVEGSRHYCVPERTGRNGPNILFNKTSSWSPQRSANFQLDSSGTTDDTKTLSLANFPIPIYVVTQQK